MLKKISKVMIGSACILAVASVLVPQEFTDNSVHAENTAFQVNVRETLSVVVDTPDTGASGGINEFLRNKVSLSVSTNNANGFTASMYSKDTTNLKNAAQNSITLPTLSSSYTRGNFPANYWGYSLKNGSYNSKTYNETEAGNNSSYYHPLISNSASPITVLTGTSSGSQDIYFGAKANMSQASGTYIGTVIISVVTDTINSNTNPITPTNPANPNPTLNTASYSPSPTGGANGSTVYTYRNSSGGRTTSTTQVSDGNNVDAYTGYTPPQGVVDKTFASVSDGSALTTGLAITSAVAATSGILFFIIAKRRDEDDDEEEEEI